MRTIYIILLFANYLLLVNGYQSTPSYCLGQILFKENHSITKFPGNNIEKQSLSTLPCTNLLVSLGYSSEIASQVIYEEHIVDNAIVIRGITSSSLSKIKNDLSGSGIGQLFGTIATVFFGMAACAGMLVFPPAGFVYIIFLLTSGGATISSIDNSDQQRLMLDALRKNVIVVDFRSTTIINQRLSFKSHLDLPTMMENNQTWSPLEQYCTWRNYMDMELIIGQSYTPSWIIQTSVFRPTILDKLSSNPHIKLQAQELLKYWSKLFNDYFKGRDPNWTAIHNYWNEIKKELPNFGHDISCH